MRQAHVHLGIDGGDPELFSDGVECRSVGLALSPAISAFLPSTLVCFQLSQNRLAGCCYREDATSGTTLLWPQNVVYLGWVGGLRSVPSDGIVRKLAAVVELIAQAAEQNDLNHAAAVGATAGPLRRSGTPYWLPLSKLTHII